MPSGVPGEGMGLLHLEWRGLDLPFAALICVENTFPPLPAAAGRAGARFFVNITSEGEVGGPMQEQLLRLCIFRAVENRISYVRVGNTGISCFIDPAGRLQSLLVGERGATISDEGVLLDHVALSDGGPTLYARSGDAFVKICVGGAVLLLLWSWLPGRWRGSALLALGLVLTGCLGPPALGEDAGAARESLERGRELYDEGRKKEALEALAAACGERSPCKAALEYAAICFEETQQQENGADFFLAVAERYPELEGVARGYRGYLLEKSLNIREAEREYRRSLALAPSLRIFGFLGDLEMQMGSVGGAITTYREGIRFAPHDFRLRYELGRALRIRGDLEESFQTLESLLTEDPTRADAWTEIGRVYLAREENEAARSSFRQAITVDPYNIAARFMLTRMLLREERPEAAHRRLNEIRKIEEALEEGGRRRSE